MRTAFKTLLTVIVTLSMGAASGQGRPPAPPADQLAAPGRAGWSVDAQTGCGVWNEDPQPDETITWSGACGADGGAVGRGVLEYRTDQLLGRYEGEMHAGRKHGRGIYTAIITGTRYDGEWRDGRADGFGIFTIAGGETYRGTWTNGCFRQGGRRMWLGATPQECGFR